jgi:hypothetical protein
MRWSALLVAWLVVSCGGGPLPPPATIAIPPAPKAQPVAVDPLTSGQRLLALVTDDNPRLESVAMSLAALGDAATRREAARRLVAFARVAPTEPPFDGDDEPQGKVSFFALLAAMSHLGGPDVEDYCFTLAEDAAAPWDRRRLALRVLEQVVDPRDDALVARRARAEHSMPSIAQAHLAEGYVSSASEAMNRIRAAARACYQRALQQDKSLEAKFTLRLRIATNGAVRTSVVGKAPPSLEGCLIDATRALKADTALGGTEIQAPLVFVRNP